MKYQRHSRQEILDAAVATVMADGLSGLTFGAVGTRLGISDRTVVYYFPTKSDLAEAVVGVLGEHLRSTLAGVLDSEPETSDQVLDLVTDWVDWLEPRIIARPGCSQRATALALVAQADGLLLLRTVAGPGDATAAAKALLARGTDS